MRIRLKLWIEEDGRVLFGGGRTELLESIARNGSLAGAARELGMSYRAAWGRLKASEERLGFDLVERGEEKRRGMRLTPRAQQLLERFLELKKSTESFVLESEDAWKTALGRDAGSGGKEGK